MPRQQHISFVKSARLSWEGNNDLDTNGEIERDSVGESSSLGMGIGMGSVSVSRKSEVGVTKRTPPPPPPRRGEIRAGI